MTGCIYSVLRKKMRKIEREKRTIEFMIAFYCKHKLHSDVITDDYAQLLKYAQARLDKCVFGDKKGTCKNCPIHCYKKDMRQRMKEVMAWAGPRMFFYAPLLSISHFIDGFKKVKKD